MDLPTKDTVETIQSITTSVGIVFAGAWAFWRWSLAEYLRRRREMPSFDGVMSASNIPTNDTRIVLSVSCVWRNVSSIPLDVNTQATQFRLFEVPHWMDTGPIAPRMENLELVFERSPWSHWPGAVLEPGTNSELQAHFLVEANKCFIIECRLEARTKSRKIKQVWVRELVWNTESPPMVIGEERNV